MEGIPYHPGRWAPGDGEERGETGVTEWTWILTLFSIVGVVLNIKKKRVSFLIWAFTNFLWMIVDFVMGIYSQAFLFFIYFILALYGLWAWRKN